MSTSSAPTPAPGKPGTCEAHASDLGRPGDRRRLACWALGLFIASPVLAPSVLLLALSLTKAGLWWLLLVVRPALAGLGAWLLVKAVRHYSARRARRASAFALAVAVTLVQPFGVEGQRVASDPRTARPAHADESLTARAGGWLPVSPWLFTTGLITFDSGEPTGTLRIGSSLWGPLMLGYSTVSDVYSRDNSSPSATDDLELVTYHGSYWLKPTPPAGPSSDNDRVWRLSFGVVSDLGLAYWCAVAALLLWLAGVARRRRARCDCAVAPPAR